MTSLKRVRTALEHGEPDKLLIDFGGMRSTGIQTIAYNRLLDHLGIRDEKAKVYDVFQQLAEPSPEVVGRLNGDAYQIHRLKPASESISSDGGTEDTTSPRRTASRPTFPRMK